MSQKNRAFKCGEGATDLRSQQNAVRKDILRLATVNVGSLSRRCREVVLVCLKEG